MSEIHTAQELVVIADDVSPMYSPGNLSRDLGRGYDPGHGEVMEDSAAVVEWLVNHLQIHK